MWRKASIVGQYLLLPIFKCIEACTTYAKGYLNLLLYKAEKPSVCPSASRDNLSGLCMDRLGTWFVHS